MENGLIAKSVALAPCAVFGRDKPRHVGAEAAVEGMQHMNQLDVISVQEMHAQLAA